MRLKEASEDEGDVDLGDQKWEEVFGVRCSKLPIIQLVVLIKTEIIEHQRFQLAIVD